MEFLILGLKISMKYLNINLTRLINNTIKYSLIAVFFIVLIENLLHREDPRSYGITEFLINYEGGFVRRGLLGQFIFEIHKFINFDIILVITLMCYTLFLVLIYYLVNKFKQHNIEFVYLTSMFFLGNIVYNGFIVRKDVLILLLFIIFIKLLKRSQKFFPYLIFLFSSMVHEVFIFISFYVLLKDIRDTIRIKDYLQLTVSILFITFALLIMIFYNGDYATAQEIYHSWFNKGLSFESNPNVLPASILGISWDTNMSIYFLKHTLSNFNGGIYAPLFWATIFAVCLFYFPICLFGNSKYKTKELQKIMLIQLAGVIILSVLGFDYGRWLFYWILSSMVIYFNYHESRHYNQDLSSEFNERSIAPVKYSPFFIGFPGAGWNLSETITKIPVVIILQKTSFLLGKLIRFLV